ncbi:MAG: AAA family ATPase [Dysgonomonas sp.]|nr:AAA family ATPase [Dysgonomonas sp.]
MILKALKYTRYAGEPREWYITGRDEDYAYFGNINLFVGKNASGKSRTLNVIREIANLLSSKITAKDAFVPTQQFDLIFKNNIGEYRYILEIKDRIVVDERLYIGGKEYLNRATKTLTDIDGNTVNFDIEDTELAVTKIDEKGIAYFSSLIAWAKSMRNYLFANQLEKRKLVSDYTKADGDEHDIDGRHLLVYTFYKGKELYGEDFINEVVNGMKELDYFISDIDIQENETGYGLCIEEEGKYIVSQQEMSQGMFRALSLFILLAYAQFSSAPFCILIDDMGEGLDFDSSKRMIDTVIRKINKSNIQLFMTTNDRNVMNHIPLRYWSVIDRYQDKSVFYDYTNSKETFEDFKYTGLNNFDFLATDFYRKGFGIMDDEND